MKALKLISLFFLILGLSSCASNISFNEEAQSSIGSDLYLNLLFEDPLEGLTIIDGEEECPKGTLSLDAKLHLAYNQIFMLPLQVKAMVLRPDLKLIHKERIISQMAFWKSHRRIRWYNRYDERYALLYRINESNETKELYRDILEESSLIALVKHPLQIMDYLPGVSLAGRRHDDPNWLVCLPEPGLRAPCDIEKVTDLIQAARVEGDCSSASREIDYIVNTNCTSNSIWQDYYASYCLGIRPSNCDIYIAEVFFLSVMDRCEDALMVYQEQLALCTAEEVNEMLSTLELMGCDLGSDYLY